VLIIPLRSIDRLCMSRFWWRDTRLSELPVPTFHPPSRPPPTTEPSDEMTLDANPATSEHRFTYPVTFLPIPYHTDTSLSSLLSHLVPLARTIRSLNVEVIMPMPTESPSVVNGGMDIDGSQICMTKVTTPATVVPDGLLLYVASASYQPGTTPLSCWVPIVDYASDEKITPAVSQKPSPTESPLDKFLRFVSCFLSYI
jgi:snurportin-1